MATRFPCPYLHGEVELAEERERHIAANHPDLLPEHRARLADTLVDPDVVRLDIRAANTYLFSRWFGTVRGGKHVVVVVVADNTAAGRDWIVTAYLTRRLSGGQSIWTRN
ncbi:MAG TPA: hypothetical protein VFL91_30400 [Thermomicrobiales bacterium]|nr:hypothetical protein [Thermomicrobiales bacterium]